MTEPDVVSDSDMAGAILAAVRMGWDPRTRDLQEGLTVAELRDIDRYERYWAAGVLTDEQAQEYLINAYHAVQEYVEALPEV